MEQQKVCRLEKDNRFEGYLLVRGAEKKTDRNGRDYVDLNLGDKTGEINAKIWNWEGTQPVPESGRPILVRGLVQEYNGRIQMRVEKWQTPRAGEVIPLEELVPSAPRNPEDMLREIRETVAGFDNRSLRKLTEAMLAMAGERLSWFPAAQRMHHAERGGLLHHTTDMLRMAKAALEVYPWLNRDLLLSGVILHDLGKLEELESDENGNVTDYTRDGQLLGHLVRGITLLNRAAEQTGVTGEPLVLLEHMLLSHHGEAEYGSPRPPMFPEAEALHWIDMMDARMNTMKGAWEKTPEGAFSEKIFSLDRRVYHPNYTEEGK
ncbi:MAG: TraI domain-containing protein [Clostridia bacterium]|nr:TraI domain-containing protein [Clostridia bacterium]